MAKHNLTPEEQVEFQRVLVGPYRTYANAFLRIQDIGDDDKDESEKGQLIPFTFNETQVVYDAVIKDMERRGLLVRLILLKARRQGITTSTSGRFYKKTTTVKNQHAVILTHEPEATETVFGMVKRFHREFPGPKPPTTYNNKDLLEFNVSEKEARAGLKGLGSSIRVATAAKENFGSSQQIELLHLSEAAKYPPHVAGKLLDSLLQCVPDTLNTEVIFESTGFGVGGEFYDRFWGARYRYTVFLKADGSPALRFEVNKDADPDNAYASLFLPWFVFRKYEIHPKDYQKFGVDSDVAFVRTEEEDSLVKAHMPDISQELADAKLRWYRWALPNKCRGSKNTRSQEFPTCISARTLVGSSLGIMPIKDMSLSVGSASEYGYIDRFIPNGRKPVYKMSTKMGYELEATADHRIMTVSGEFVALSDCLGKKIKLQPPIFGDQIQIINVETLPLLKATILVDEDFARFAGYFMGDGSYSRETLSICCDRKDEDVIVDVENLMRKYIGEPSRRIVGSKEGGVELRVSRKNITSVFEQIGFIEQRGFKEIHSNGWKRVVHVPDWIMRSPEHIIREFLKGLFEADGFSAYKSARVVFFSQYESFLKDLQLLVLGFGITCMRTSRPAINGNKFKYTARELIFRTTESKEFLEKIGFVSSRKNRNMDAAANREKKPGGHPRYAMNLEDEVVSIQPVGEADVYDLTINGSPMFGANGILVHNCAREAFVFSGNAAFDNMKIEELMKSCKPPKARYSLIPQLNQFYTDEQGPLLVWEEPNRNSWYIIPGDAAEGKTASDYNSVDVIDAITGIQVAHWHGHISPDEFAYLLSAIGWRYNCAWVVPERNNHGGTTITHLVKLIQYPHVYISGKKIDGGQGSVDYGFWTSRESKLKAINNLDMEVREGDCGIRCKQTFEEMLTYVKHPDGTYGGIKSKSIFDDRVSSIIIGKWVRRFGNLQPATAPGAFDTVREARQGSFGSIGTTPPKPGAYD